MGNFLFNVPSGEAVVLEPFHFAIIGQTQFSGKTTLIKRLADWATQQDFKVLIFDTKETEADYAGFGSEAVGEEFAVVIGGGHSKQAKLPGAEWK